jgi:SPP1 family predicted phage head-tail adaptor
MRTAVETLFPDVCHLLTITRTTDGQGGSTDAWGTATKNVPCRVDQMIGSERQTDGSLRSFTSLELAIPWDTTITEAYRVEHGGNTYNVINANVDQSWQLEKLILLERTP